MPQKDNLVALVGQYWPAGAVLLALLGWLASNGFVDGVVHVSAFERLKVEVQHGATQNQEAHGRLEQTVGDIRRGVDKIIETQQRQGEAIVRIEASRR